MTAKEYFGDWSKVVDLAKADRIMKRLHNIRSPVCPSLKNVFKAFTLCSLHDLKVVIIGQNPYPDLKNGVPVATGIAFANSSNTSEKDYSPSLSVLMESVIDFTCPHEDINFDPTFESWESQGVLMLNSSLSCLAGKLDSHTLLWRPFMRSFLTNLSAYNTGIVYVLMGTAAQSFASYINPRYNHILNINHPSWYVHTSTKMPHAIWLYINIILQDLYGSKIKWY